MPNFTKEKEALLVNKLTFDGDINVEDVAPRSLKISQKLGHKFVTQVLLEVICSHLEADDSKREELFNAAYNLLSGEVNVQIPLKNFAPDRIKLANEIGRKLREIHNIISPNPRPDIKPLGPIPVKQKLEDDFDEITFIAKGGFGAVYKAKHKIDGLIYAIKLIKFDYKEDNDCGKVLREVKNISALKHINIVSYNNAWIDRDRKRKTKCDEAGVDAKSECEINADEDSTSSSISSEIAGTFSNESPESTEEANTTREILRLSEDYVESSTSFITFRNPSSSFASGKFSEISVSRKMEMEEDTCKNSLGNSEQASFKTTFSQREVKKLSKINYNRIHRNLSKSFKVDLKNMHAKSLLCIQMEYCDSNLRIWLKVRTEEEELPFVKSVPDIFKDIVCGLVYIHTAGIIHRDLKPDNIFYSKKENVMKIGDFGLATFTKKSPSVTPTKMDTSSSSPCHSHNLGSFPYYAPEQARRSNYDTRVDLYSLGVILIELLIPIKTVMEHVGIIRRPADHMSALKGSFPRYGDLVPHLVAVNPEHRMSAKDVLTSLLQEDSPEKETLLLKLREENNCLKDERNTLIMKTQFQDEKIKELQDTVKEMMSRILELKYQIAEQEAKQST